MDIYITSDLHIGFSVNKPMNIFGEHWNDHHIKIKNDWQSKVQEDDYVIIAGDISWAINLKEVKADMEWIRDLNGNKIISKGNHDYWWQSMKKLNDNFPYISFLQNNSYIIKNIGIIGTRSWISPINPESNEHDKKIYARECNRLMISIQNLESKKEYKSLKEIFCILHYPPFDESGAKTPMIDIINDYNNKNNIKITKVFYGHVHKNHERVIQGRFSNVDYRLITCDYTDFKIVKIT